MLEEQITIAEMKKDIDYVKRDLGELKDLVVELPQKIDNAINMLSKEFDRREEKYNTKYAPMYAWKVLVWSASIIGGLIILYSIRQLFHLSI